MNNQKKKEQLAMLKNYEHSVHAGIISGLIVAITLMAYNLIINKSNNVIFAFILGVIVISLLYYMWVIRPIERQKKVWGIK